MESSKRSPPGDFHQPESLCSLSTQKQHLRVPPWDLQGKGIPQPLRLVAARGQSGVRRKPLSGGVLPWERLLLRLLEAQLQAERRKAWDASAFRGLGSKSREGLLQAALGDRITHSPRTQLEGL